METVDHYELLCRLAHERGWKVRLHSDQRGGEPNDETASRLVELGVSDGQGELVGSTTIMTGEELAEPAKTLLSRLERAGLLRQ